MALYFYPPQPQLTLPTYPPHRKTAPIAQTCYQFNTPFAIVRAISDTADSHASHSFEEFITLAGKHSAEMVRQIVQHID